MLTDLALQLAEGERILLRSHKAISADRMFALAIRVARERRDHATLKRLTRAVQQRDDKLRTATRAAATLAASSRAAAPVRVPLDTAPQVFTLYKLVQRECEQARIRQNPQRLKALAEGLAGFDVADNHRKRMLSMLAQQQTLLAGSRSDSGSGTAAAVQALDQLVAESRGEAEVADDLPVAEPMEAEQVISAEEPAEAAIAGPLEFGSRSGAPADNRSPSERVVWRHLSGFFENTRGNSWFENGEAGGARYRESRRTSDYVELEKLMGDDKLRLYADRCMAWRADEERWVQRHQGAWETQSPAPAPSDTPPVIDPAPRGLGLFTSRASGAADADAAAASPASGDKPAGLELLSAGSRGGRKLYNQGDNTYWVAYGWYRNGTVAALEVDRVHVDPYAGCYTKGWFKLPPRWSINLPWNADYLRIVRNTRQGHRIVSPRKAMPMAYFACNDGKRSMNYYLKIGLNRQQPYRTKQAIQRKGFRAKYFFPAQAYYSRDHGAFVVY